MSTGARARITSQLLATLLISHAFGTFAMARTLSLVEAERADQCEPVLAELLPKVALLFLVRGPQPHEQTWTYWLTSLANLTTANVHCDETAWSCHEAALRHREQPLSVYDQQHFYSIYVHTKPDYPGYPKGSIFHGRVIHKLQQTAWGSVSLVGATLELFRAALSDPLNQRFQLVCESTIPVRPALFVYQQLMAERKSRIPLLGPHDEPDPSETKHMTFRFPLPALEALPGLKEHMKGHGQFIMLNRKHAELVAKEHQLYSVMREHCNLDADAFSWHRHFCIADEQYIGTLLSMLLETPERLWSEVSPEPVLYKVMTGDDATEPEQFTMDFLMEARGTVPLKNATSFLKDVRDIDMRGGVPWGRCHATERPATLLWDYSGRQEHRCGNEDWEFAFSKDDIDIFHDCPLFIRKVPSTFSDAVFQLLLDVIVI